MEKVWKTRNIFNPAQDSVILVVLNYGIDENNSKTVTNLWSKAFKSVCVDGGLNFFHKHISKKSQEKEESPNSTPCIQDSILLPNLISGDFDSVSSELLDIYRNKGVEVIETPDQNATDFTKAIQLLEGKTGKARFILALAGSNSSRFDHIFGIIQTLYKAPQYVEIPVMVLSGSSLYWLLPEGTNTIEVPMSIVNSENDSWCGLISLTGPTKVTTNGLKWDLDGQMLSFDVFNSTSNSYNKESNGLVTVINSKPILWTMGVNLHDQ